MHNSSQSCRQLALRSFHGSRPRAAQLRHGHDGSLHAHVRADTVTHDFVNGLAHARRNEHHLCDRRSHVVLKLDEFHASCYSSARQVLNLQRALQEGRELQRKKNVRLAFWSQT